MGNEWKRSVWAAYLSALLKGRALDCHLMTLPIIKKMKDALLKNFDMTERGFRKKYRYEVQKS